MTRRKLCFLHAIFLILAACAAPNRLEGLQPGLAREADVRALAGAPQYVWSNPDGTRTQDYSAQPYGAASTYRVLFSADGQVLKLERIDVDADHSGISIGMSRDAVRRKLGVPRSVVHFPLSGEEVWDWNTQSYGISSRVRLNVHFKEAVVVRTSTRTIDPNDCSIISPC